MLLRAVLLLAALMGLLRGAAAVAAGAPAAGASDSSPEPAYGASRGHTAPAGSLAAVELEHRRQRALCQDLLVAAVRAECLRQADRSRAEALTRLRAKAASAPPQR